MTQHMSTGHGYFFFARRMVVDVTPLRARLRVETEGGDALARATTSDQAPVTVERDAVDAAEHGRVGGSGSVTIAVG